MAIEKFRTRIFSVSDLTVNGKFQAPVQTSFVTSTSLTANGQLMVAGTQRLYWRQNGTTYFVNASGTV